MQTPLCCRGCLARTAQVLFDAQENALKCLSTTRFMSELVQLASALLADTVDAQRPRLGEFTRSFSRQEEYLRDTFVSAGELVTACDQLHYALAYLSGYRSRRTHAGELISRADYLAYQLENLHLRLGMVSDRALKLANVVFLLGLPAREVKERSVVDNENIRGTSARKRLQKINRIVQPHREIRNSIAHHERYRDDGLTRLETFFVLEKSEESPQYPAVEGRRVMMKARTDAYVDEKRTQLEPVVEKLIEAVAAYLDSLVPIFLPSYQRLGLASNKPVQSDSLAAAADRQLRWPHSDLSRRCNVSERRGIIKP
jgi:hypothetical protein